VHTLFSMRGSIVQSIAGAFGASAKPRMKAAIWRAPTATSRSNGWPRTAVLVVAVTIIYYMFTEAGWRPLLPRHHDGGGSCFPPWADTW